MSADDDPTDETERKSYGLLGRVILFLFITGPGTVIALGLWIRIGSSTSLTAAIHRGDWSGLVIFSCWVIGMLGSAFAIFKP